LGALLALFSAVCYGIADFAGGLLSRRAHFAAIAIVGQAAGFLVTLIVAPLTSPNPAPDDLAWGALSGIGTGLGMLFLYRGLGRGDMSVVVPISAVGGVALPVLIGVALLGDRPATVAWLGIAVAIPALWLVARAGSGFVVTGQAGDGLVAGCGIALQYIALAQAGTDAGIWSVAAGRLTAALTILPLAGTSAAPVRLPARLALPAAATGVLASLALVCYLLATTRQLVVVAVVLSSFYPAIPVLLGITALRERLVWPQAVGLLLSAVAVGLLAVA
jgi:uncharacterized membrane protein